MGCEVCYIHSVDEKSQESETGLGNVNSEDLGDSGVCYLPVVVCVVCVCVWCGVCAVWCVW